jgi:signal transduction histidine kinase/CheY-like chemotaxis protein
MAVARQLASSAEYGVFSGNTAVLDKLLEQAMAEPGVASAAVIWPDQTRQARGEPIGRLPPLSRASQWQEGRRSWFAYPVRLSPLDEGDPFIENSAPASAPLAWVAVSIDLHRKQALAQELLLASLGITLLGLALATVLIYTLALTGLQPLLDIIDSVKRISSGGFGTHMDVTAHAPELRELQLMVNQMSESLRSYQQEMETRVHKVTAELEHKKREAEQASLAKSRFLAAASHDLRQPMHALSLYVESLKPQMRGRAAEDILNKIERSVLSTVELFNAILDVTKLDAGVIQPSLAPVRIRRLLLGLADEFAADADNKGLSLRVRAPDDWVETDAILLERIVRNLLSNAIRHTARGGVLLSARPYRGKLRLQVWDTGSGIAPENQPRVFDEFFQVEPREAQAPHGLGLGLAIVRRLAQLLDYPLRLHSRPAQGTVFSLDVPVPANRPSDFDAAGVGSGGVLKGCAVIVDDDPAILNALGHLLQQWGMDVLPFQSLRQLVHELEAAPDIVVADYQLLDGETGLMVAHEVRTRWGAHIPVVLITGDTRTETIQALRQSGFAVLYKPVPADQLRALLGILLQDQTALRANR